MRIISELLIEVDNEIYQGQCKLIGLEEYPGALFDMCFEKHPAYIDGKEYEVFIALSTVYENDIESEEISVYLLAEQTESLIDKEIEIKGA